jgi:hypothetical protein
LHRARAGSTPAVSIHARLRSVNGKHAPFVRPRCGFDSCRRLLLHAQARGVGGQHGELQPRRPGFEPWRACLEHLNADRTALEMHAVVATRAQSISDTASGAHTARRRGTPITTRGETNAPAHRSGRGADPQDAASGQGDPARDPSQGAPRAGTTRAVASPTGRLRTRSRPPEPRRRLPRADVAEGLRAARAALNRAGPGRGDRLQPAPVSTLTDAAAGRRRPSRRRGGQRARAG